MVKLLLHEKVMSEIDGLQEAAKIRYSLTECDGGFGIEISEAKHNCVESDITDRLSFERRPVERLITFLYENCISVSTFKDVIENLQAEKEVLYGKYTAVNS